MMFSKELSLPDILQSFTLLKYIYYVNIHERKLIGKFVMQPIHNKTFCPTGVTNYR